MQLFRTQALEHQNRLHGEVFLVPPLRWQAIGWLLFIAVAAGLLILAFGMHSQSVEAGGVLDRSTGQQSATEATAILAVEPAQIALIDLGQPVSISLNSYPAREFGFLNGKVAHIATNPSNDAELRFTVIVALDPLSDQQRAKGMMLRNNWPVEGRIIIQKQSILAWLTRPKSAGYAR